MNIHLEEMNASHIDAIAALEKRCFSDPWSKKLFEQELTNERSYYVVLLDDDTVIGYAGFWKIFDEGHIMNIAVAPEYRGQHLSHLLMKAFLEFAARSEIRYLTLEVREGNIPARNLYYQYGFEDAGVRKAYYQDNGENAIIMWADLEKKC